MHIIFWTFIAAAFRRLYQAIAPAVFSPVRRYDFRATPSITSPSSFGPRPDRHETPVGKDQAPSAYLHTPDDGI